MKQTLIKFALLCATLFFVVHMKAQVTIGDTAKPVDGALLQLTEKTIPSNDTGSTSDRGLMLPRIQLKEKNESSDVYATIQHSNPSYIKSGWNVSSHIGLTIYNITLNKAKDLCPGVYVWQGSSWEKLGPPCDESTVTPIPPSNPILTLNNKNFEFYSGISNNGYTNNIIPGTLNANWTPTNGQLTIAPTAGGNITLQLNPNGPYFGGSAAITIQPNSWAGNTVVEQIIKTNPFYHETYTTTATLKVTNSDGSTSQTTETITVTQVHKNLVPLYNDANTIFIQTNGEVKLQVKDPNTGAITDLGVYGRESLDGNTISIPIGNFPSGTFPPGSTIIVKDNNPNKDNNKDRFPPIEIPWNGAPFVNIGTNLDFIFLSGFRTASGNENKIVEQYIPKVEWGESNTQLYIERELITPGYDNIRISSVGNIGTPIIHNYSASPIQNFNITPSPWRPLPTSTISGDVNFPKEEQSVRFTSTNNISGNSKIVKVLQYHKNQVLVANSSTEVQIKTNAIIEAYVNGVSYGSMGSETIDPQIITFPKSLFASAPTGNIIFIDKTRNADLTKRFDDITIAWTNQTTPPDENPTITLQTQTGVKVNGGHFYFPSGLAIDYNGKTYQDSLPSEVNSLRKQVIASWTPYGKTMQAAEVYNSTDKIKLATALNSSYASQPVFISLVPEAWDWDYTTTLKNLVTLGIMNSTDDAFYRSTKQIKFTVVNGSKTVSDVVYVTQYHKAVIAKGTPTSNGNLTFKTNAKVKAYVVGPDGSTILKDVGIFGTDPQNGQPSEYTANFGPASDYPVGSKIIIKDYLNTIPDPSYTPGPSDPPFKPLYEEHFPPIEIPWGTKPVGPSVPELVIKDGTGLDIPNGKEFTFLSGFKTALGNENKIINQALASISWKPNDSNTALSVSISSTGNGNISFSNIPSGPYSSSPITNFNITPKAWSTLPTSGVVDTDFPIDSVTIKFTVSNSAGQDSKTFKVKQIHKNLVKDTSKTGYCFKTNAKVNAYWKNNDTGSTKTINTYGKESDKPMAECVTETPPTGWTNVTLVIEDGTKNPSPNETVKRFDDLEFKVDTKKPFDVNDPCNDAYSGYTMQDYKDAWMKLYCPAGNCPEGSNGTSTSNTKQVQWHTDQDGNIFFSAKIGNYRWMTTNLATKKTTAGDSLAYVNAEGQKGGYLTYHVPGSVAQQNKGASAEPPVSGKLGLLYNFATARTVCPPGWTLPTRTHFEYLQAEVVTYPNKYTVEDRRVDFDDDSKIWLLYNAAKTSALYLDYCATKISMGNNYWVDEPMWTNGSQQAGANTYAKNGVVGASKHFLLGGFDLPVAGVYAGVKDDINSEPRYYGTSNYRKDGALIKTRPNHGDPFESEYLMRLYKEAAFWLNESNDYYFGQPKISIPEDVTGGSDGNFQILQFDDAANGLSVRCVQGY